MLLSSLTSHSFSRQVLYPNCVRLSRAHGSPQGFVRSQSPSFVASRFFSTASGGSRSGINGIRSVSPFCLARRQRWFSSQKETGGGDGKKPWWHKLNFSANPWSVAFSGLLGGVLGASCGVGGGIVMIPLLRHLTNLSAQQIAGTSIFAVAIGAVGAASNYTLNSDLVRVPIAAMMACVSTVFAFVGASVAASISGRALTKATGLSIALSIPFVLMKTQLAGVARKTEGESGSAVKRDAEILEERERVMQRSREDALFQSDPFGWLSKNGHFGAVAVIAGFLSGLIGVGGGIVWTTYMSAFTDLTQKEAVATSLTAMIPGAFMSALTHYRHGHIQLSLGLVLAAACAVGMTGSSVVTQQIPDNYLRAAFCLLLGVTGARMLL
uniref:Membrane transporter protein n=1 Tax=Chromera velia CCMP2878 TaxID=1169474 RepID=A0A0G4G3N9_9ALVE|eukprot:Cvel_20041.t1-p1 / transcript=Cvel_20041.t1 / gene=Cvel_20041 / organism=Chromera_velia_CCMP2878 / gene_product=hypothetical protein / transcript_product=hypothetical protein / location=Cvel_scaffold1771:12671-13813(-) / protein_length=381 / sequence_SO=supercontig / SO=protein_coding / is_pseudo=false